MRPPYRVPSPARKPALALLMFAAVAGPASAQDCGSAATQTDMNACAAQDLRAAEAKLDRSVQTIAHRLAGQPPVLAQWRAAQRSWLAFRDAECAFASSIVEGGSIHPLIELTCRTGLTAQRAQAVQRYLACKDGEMDCPVPPR